MHKLLILKVIIVFWVTVAFIHSASAASAHDLSRRLVEAKAKGAPLPNLSKEASIDMACAYDIQTAFVKEHLTQDKIAGFKAGLTNPESQLLLGINRPIFGVLFESGDFSHKAEIALAPYHDLMVETELGFITKTPIKHTVHSVAQLKTYISQVVPVIELPDVGFVHKTISAPDLVAANTGSSGYIVPGKINWYNEDINAITVSLMHNGVIVNQGQGIDAMGDQWEALRWLVNQVIAHGWIIEKDQLLITGALGSMVHAKPGTYRAQFNDGASIEFKLKT